MRALLLVLYLITTPAIAADQFDLVCKGQQRQRSGVMRPIEQRYRVDLVAKRWCVDACTTIDTLASVDDNVVVFVDDEEKFRGDFWELDRVFRQTGLWTHLRSNTDPSLEIQGRCEAAPFSGFPAVQHKF